MMKYATYISVLIGVSLGVLGCASHSPGNKTYVPLYAAHVDASKTKLLDPREGDWHWAGTAPNLREAATRWEIYLQKHYSQNDLEDGADLYMRETAQYELMRIYYLLGDHEKGDKILRSRDPLELLKKSD